MWWENFKKYVNVLNLDTILIHFCDFDFDNPLFLISNQPNLKNIILHNDDLLFAGWDLQTYFSASTQMINIQDTSLRFTSKTSFTYRYVSISL